MTTSELKNNVNQGPDNHFFDRSSMRFFGDSIRNYGVRDAGENWELYRKSPVRHGLKSSAFFNKTSFRRV